MPSEQIDYEVIDSEHQQASEYEKVRRDGAASGCGYGIRIPDKDILQNAPASMVKIRNPNGDLIVPLVHPKRCHLGEVLGLG